MTIVIAENSSVAHATKMFDDAMIILVTDNVEQIVNSTSWTELYVLVGNDKHAVADILVRKSSDSKFIVNLELIIDKIDCLINQYIDVNMPANNDYFRQFDYLSVWKPKSPDDKENRIIQILFGKSETTV